MISKYVIAFGLVSMSVAPLVICRQCAKEYTTAKLSELTFGALFYLGIGIVLIGIALSVIGL